MKLSDQELRQLARYFSDQPVIKAYLFGSHARGEAIEGSDVDILLDLDYQHVIGLRFLKMKLDLQEILRKNVDLVSSKGLSKYIRPFVDKEKILIYAR